MDAVKKAAVLDRVKTEVGWNVGRAAAVPARAMARFGLRRCHFVCWGTYPVKGSRYDKMMEAFGGVGVNATSPDDLKRAVNEAMDSGKPTLINAVLDPAAGSESGRIGNLNPQSALKKKK